MADTVQTKITVLLWPRRISAADDRPLPEVAVVGDGCYRIRRRRGAELVWFATVETEALSYEAERGSLWLNDAGCPVGGSYVNGHTMRTGNDLVAHTPEGADLAFAFDLERRRLRVTVKNLDKCPQYVIVAPPANAGNVRLAGSAQELEHYLARGRLHVIVPPGVTQLEGVID